MTGSTVLEARQIRVRRAPGFELYVEQLTLAAGEVLALLGPNGAGKSTLLQTLALLEHAGAGEILLGGERVGRDTLRARRRTAVLLQEPLLLHGTVTENVSLGLRLHGTARDERRRRTSVWMERTGIADLAGRRARSLSGGEQRRVSLARALALEPLVLFMDEPLAALDAPTRRSLLAELPAWLRTVGCGVVLVTHDRDEALQLADRVAVLIAGRLRQVGPVEEVFARPADAEVAAFLGVENILHGDVIASDGETARVRVGAVELVAAVGLAPGPVLVTVHPEQVLLLAATERLHSSARNVLPCRVVAVRSAGAQLRVHLDAGVPLLAAVTRAAAQELALAPGTTVQAAIKATAVHLIARR